MVPGKLCGAAAARIVDATSSPASDLTLGNRAGVQDAPARLLQGLGVTTLTDSTDSADACTKPQTEMVATSMTIENDNMDGWPIE